MHRHPHVCKLMPPLSPWYFKERDIQAAPYCPLTWPPSSDSSNLSHDSICLRVSSCPFVFTLVPSLPVIRHCLLPPFLPVLTPTVSLPSFIPLYIRLSLGGRAQGCDTVEIEIQSISRRSSALCFFLSKELWEKLMRRRQRQTVMTR